MMKRELTKNKLFALIFVAVGLIAIPITHDGTFLAFALMFGIPMFFSKENWVM